jgi:hypothetical protein
VSDELVQIWRQRDGSWRWRYVVLDHTELRSNRGYESAAEAARSARQAYPGVAILAPADGEPSANGTRRRRASMTRTAVVSASAVFALLTAWYLVRQRGPVPRGR